MVSSSIRDKDPPCIFGAQGQGVIGQWATDVRDLMLDRVEELTGARIYHMFEYARTSGFVSTSN